MAEKIFNQIQAIVWMAQNPGKILESNRGYKYKIENDCMFVYFDFNRGWGECKLIIVSTNETEFTVAPEIPPHHLDGVICRNDSMPYGRDIRLWNGYGKKPYACHSVNALLNHKHYEFIPRETEPDYVKEMRKALLEALEEKEKTND